VIRLNGEKKKIICSDLVVCSDISRYLIQMIIAMWTSIELAQDLNREDIETITRL